jgi:hypothetical protein
MRFRRLFEGARIASIVISIMRAVKSRDAVNSLYRSHKARMADANSPSLVPPELDAV